MKKIYLSLSFFALFLSGCASITQGTTQVISFSIDPQEAKCAVVNKDNATLGTVSGKANLLQVSKGSGDLIANCTAEGYEQKTTRIVSSTQTAGVLGVAIDLGIVDMLTGAMWKYPDHVSIAMDKTSTKK
jgi:PBP1b-binding outer membrane lipoprotein LpoB